jgi:hypothetical protein
MLGLERWRLRRAKPRCTTPFRLSGNARQTPDTLDQLARAVAPDDTCPILPFPSRDPRIGDRLLESYRQKLVAWEVDPRDVIYAAEGDPLDLYRTLVRLWAEREQVFHETGGSELLVSPLGSKVVGIGALMAALDKKLSIRYVESVSYEVDFAAIDTETEIELVHVWLHGGPNWKI